MNEVTISDELLVEAPLAEVWAAIEDPAAHARWHPFVTEITGAHGLDQIRDCSVLVGGKAGRTRERCVDYELHRRIVWRIEKDSTGFGRMVANWRAGFALTTHKRGTLVTAESTFQPRALVRPMVALIRPRFHRTQQAILRALGGSVVCASSSPDAPGSKQ